MNLVTPEAGLLFWMVVIFGIVFLLLWKFGFPIITSSLESRNKRIQKSLDDARDLEVKMQQWTADHARMLEEARKEQSAILREATDAKNKIVADAKVQAQEEADKILSKARTEIEAEKAAALADVRREVAVLGVQIAEKILRKELSDDAGNSDYVDAVVKEVSRQKESAS